MSIPYMPLYCGDYEADTAHLTIEEDGAYMRLLRLCWRSPGCTIPSDPEWIMRRMRVDAETYQRVVGPILSEFFKTLKGRVYSARLSAEFSRITATYEKRRAAGEKGGRPSKSLKTNGSGERRANAMQKPEESNQNQNQNQNQNHKEKEVRAPAAATPPGPRLEDFVSPEAASDYRAHRIALKAKLTPGAEKGICRELEKICAMGIDPTEALETGAARGWRAIKADWIINDRSKDQSNGLRAGGPRARAEAASDAADDFWTNYDVQTGRGDDRRGAAEWSDGPSDDSPGNRRECSGFSQGVVLRPAAFRC